MWFIGVEVELIQRRVHPLLKKILDPPLCGTIYVARRQLLQLSLITLVAMGSDWVSKVYQIQSENGWSANLLFSSY